MESIALKEIHLVPWQNVLPKEKNELESELRAPTEDAISVACCEPVFGKLERTIFLVENKMPSKLKARLRVEIDPRIVETTGELEAEPDPILPLRELEDIQTDPMQCNTPTLQRTVGSILTDIVGNETTVMLNVPVFGAFTAEMELKGKLGRL